MKNIIALVFLAVILHQNVLASKRKAAASPQYGGSPSGSSGSSARSGPAMSTPKTPSPGPAGAYRSPSPYGPPGFASPAPGTPPTPGTPGIPGTPGTPVHNPGGLDYLFAAGRGGNSPQYYPQYPPSPSPPASPQNAPYSPGDAWSTTASPARGSPSTRRSSPRK
ncbi:hypothetical protein LSTR_LSTR010710 [Laodelphax striatellus]|uniref:Uncharacterized protein n=1 Tax=Laodelphax striatellus TaxID=195883 RepID=A0A482WZJ8_LAOST|nr:hypothetical protein LSTR_LSTR010710 [Laodelphax striatellus]